MPFNLTVTQGAMTQQAIEKAVKTITKSMLSWHGLTDNKTMTPNITSIVNIIDKNKSFVGGEQTEAIWIEWRTPAFAFANREAQIGHFKDCTDALFKLSEQRISKDRIFINVVHAIDGAWNFDGQALTNEQIGQAIS